MSTFPFASLSVAVSCTVCPRPTLAGAGVTVTDATVTTTVSAAVPLRPSLVAVMVAWPAATPVTSPVVLTVATAVLLLAQVTLRPARNAPFASLGVAVSCAVAPTPTVKVCGATASEATGACGPSLWQVASSRTAAAASRRLNVCAIRGSTHLSCGSRCPPDLNPQGRAFTQYDNSSRQLGTDVRIRWTFRSSGDFFVTYNHNIDVPLGSRPWTFDSNRLSTKLQYALRY